MFKGKYFWYGFFGFLAATFLFFRYDMALFQYRSTKKPVAELIEQKTGVLVDKTHMAVKEDHMLVTLAKGKIQNYKKIKELIKGKNTVLLMWTPTCDYCIDQLRRLEVFRRTHKKINVLTVGTYGDLQDAVKKHKSNNSDVFVYDNDPKLTLLRTLAADMIQNPSFGFPFYVFFNKKGQIIARLSGSLPWDQLGDDIAHARFN